MSKSHDRISSPGDHLPERKRTVLGLYITAKDAYAAWLADPKRVRILDVRTPEEYIFVGHGEMARNIPLLFIKYEWDVAKGEPAINPNADFIAAASHYYGKDDMLMVTCRSGGRSKLAVDALTKAGFTRVYNIVDGMEGDKVDDPGSVFHGKRMKNGWKNSGAPWTYDVDPPLLWLSDQPS